jgi:hypothetical protein
MTMKNPSWVVIGHATSSDVQFMLSSSDTDTTSTLSTGSVAESAPPEYTELFNKILSECLKWVGQAGKEIPPQWDMPDLLRTVVIGDEDMEVIHPFLTDTYYEIILHGPNSRVISDILAWIDLINYAPPLV